MRPPSINSTQARLLAWLLGLALCAASSAVAQERGSTPLQGAKKRFQENEKRDTRIIGGEDTTFAENPWQVALLYSDDKEDYARAQFCGGVIVHPKWVLTAAHCVDNGTLAGDVDVLSGTDVLIKGQGMRTAAVAIIVHPQWRGTRNFDIALLNVNAPLRGKPIALAADASPLVPGAKIWVSGWGVTQKAGAKPSRKLQGISLDFIPQGTEQGECNGPLSYSGKVTENMFCAGVKGRSGGGGRDSCQGDSGGPASIGPPDAARLVGLVSWGEGCGDVHKYGVYTRVPRVLDWITANSNGEVAP
jgi:secreted trypsin-like serine protease